MSASNDNPAPFDDTSHGADNGTGERRLPPPAFPPGSRRMHVRRSITAPESLEDAFISPDEPLPERSGIPDDAFISPDEPVQHREPHATAVADTEGVGDFAFDADEVVVTGIGDDPHLDPTELAAGGDPYVIELVEHVGKLSEALKRRGEAGLKSTTEMTRFEATLRAYCVGYLAGRRAEEADGER